jgi:hypothetical protein
MIHFQVLHATQAINLLKKLHNPKITHKRFISDAAKSCFGCQAHEFCFRPFLPSWVLSHHKHIHLTVDLRRSAHLRHSRKNCLHNNYLSIIWSSIVAVLQQLQALFITPIMEYPLQKVSINYDIFSHFCSKTFNPKYIEKL